MTTNYTSYIYFRMHMYSINTWLIILDCAIKSCLAGIHVQFEMNVLRTFGDHGMGGGVIVASLRTFSNSDAALK